MYDGTWAMQHLMTHIQQHTHTAKFAVRKLYDRNNTKKNRVGGNSKKHICSSSFNHSIAHTHTHRHKHMNMCSWAFSFKTMRARGNGKGKAGNVNARKAKKRERKTMFADKKIDK